MQNILRKAREAREFLTPVLKNSKFLSDGVLTPEEFVKAGDNLTFKCPTWRWESGDPQHRKPYLPENKQYLCTRGVPCRARVSVMEAEYAKTTASLIAPDSEGGGSGEAGDGAGDGRADWTVLWDGDDKKGKKDTGADAAGAGGEAVPGGGDATTAAAGGGGGGDGSDSDDDSDYLDMETFEEENLVQPDAAALPAAAHPEGSSGGGAATSNIEKTRTYDLSITYDNYYKTPRVWLFGYNRHGSPLPSERIFEDIAVDYRERTVTIEPHPHLHNMMHASIHPCKHAAVMKKIVSAMLSAQKRQTAAAEAAAPADTLTAGGGGGGGPGAPAVEAYLFIFLKFIQSVIPTVDYDFTMSVSFNLNAGGGGDGGGSAT